MSDAALAGKRVRLHRRSRHVRRDQRADPGLAQKAWPHPSSGVGSVFAAAAALGCELTSPDVSQSVVLTRTPGRTPMPQAKTPRLRPDRGDAGLFPSTERSAS
ncbi:MAG: hypothetical protein ACLSHC_13825 [Bilophila wadsworthia]